MVTHPVFLLGKFHGQRSMAGYSPWGRKELGTLCKELDTTERAQTHTHTIYIYIYIKLEVNAVKKSSLSNMLRISFELSLKGVVDKICEIRASLAAQTVKNLPAMQETWPPSLGREELLE